MRRARRDAYGIAGLDFETLLAEKHQTAPSGHVVQLFSAQMLVQQRLLSWLHDSFGQALLRTGMTFRMHQLANF